MRCTRCKKQLKKGAKYCTYCGTKVVKKKGKRVVSFLLAVLLLLSLGTIGLSVYFFIPEDFSVQKALSDLFSAQPTVKINNAEEAIAHAKELGKEFGYENAMSEMTEKVTTEIDGDCYYRLQQNYKGIPIYGNSLVCVTDEKGRLSFVSGNLMDIPDNIELIPSISEYQALEAVNTYVNKDLDIFEDLMFQSDGIDISLCLYHVEECNEFKLTYCIDAGWIEFIVDAQTAEIYSYIQNIQDIFAYSAKDERRAIGYTVEINDDGLYSMRHPELCISVWDINGKSHKKADSMNTVRSVTSSDDVFGNSDDESGYDRALELYSNIVEISQYFRNQCHFDYEEIFIFINDGYSQGCNASGGEYCINPETGGFIGQLAIGNKIDYNTIDVLAHEYGHIMSRKTVGWTGRSIESGAISEGISDIFGELYVLIHEGTTDWCIGPEYQSDNLLIEGTLNLVFADKRNIANPADSNNATSTANYSNWEDKYFHSTIISHAAYLMWNGIDGSNSKRIGANDLIKLWYRAMLMMPSDCDFATCRQMVEWAALSVDGLTKAQRDCIAEAFDMVGIHDQELSPEILVNCDRNIRPSSKLNIYNVDGDLHPSYTLTVSGTCAEHELAYAPTVLTDIGFRYNKTVEIKKAASYELDLPDGYYAFTITDSNNPQYTYSFTVSVSDQGTDDSIELYTEFRNQLLVKVTEPPVSDAHKAYSEAARKTTETGSWTENLNVTASMALTNDSAKTKTKMTMTSDAYVSGYSETDLSKLFMSGSAEMSVLGQTYAWNMRYEDGIAHYKYTQPNQTSTDMAIDPGFFNFGTITSDMMTNAKISGNQITFTVPGDKITEVGIAAVNQMSGVDDLKYGDVDVTVVIGQEGTIETVAMKFHASLQYQGYDAEVDYDIAYRFSSGSSAREAPSVSISPCSYTNEDNKYDILTLHEVNGNEIVFSIWWYRTWDLSHATATLNGNVASFDFTDENLPGTWAKGTIEFTEGRAVFQISQCSYSLLNNRSWDFVFLAEALSEQQLKEIGRFLRVPDDLPVTYKQGIPYYWEAVGIYCTEVGIYHDGALIAGGDVNPLTGAVAGGIYMYSG